MRLRLYILLLCLVFPLVSFGGNKLFIPMDAEQANHLKAYGIIYNVLQQGQKAEWLLNYKGGSFALDYTPELAAMCKERGVVNQKITVADYTAITRKVITPKYNGDVIKLNRPPKIAVYTPLNKEPWDDAVTLALTYAQIPFDKIYADEVLAGALDGYDWLHLHHEDFTGQYGKFWMQFHDAQWYKDDQHTMEAMAARNGFKKVQPMQLAVAKKIKDFVANGGNLFAMCSATETLDIALAADTTDICAGVFDGDPADERAQQKLNYANCFAFRDFVVYTDPFQYGHSNIDNTATRAVPKETDYFTVNTVPAQPDPVPAMLCQNHVTQVKGFMGQTTAFRTQVLKSGVLVLAQNTQAMEARYLHGDYGRGSWTYYSGHDPEDYAHVVGAPATDLSQHPQSPGYRLILNNLLFMAAKPASAHTDPAVAKQAPLESNPAAPSDRNRLFPDPSNDMLKIEITQGKINEVIITNAAGKTVLTHTYNEAGIRIDMSTFPPGLYLIKVNGAYAGKILKN